MASSAHNEDELRDRILADPDVVLEDQDVMRALVAANEKTLGGNIVDLRGIAMERLEARLDRLEDTHRSVIAAAYENLAGTNQVHRAILRMLDPVEFEGFLQNLGAEVAEVLRVDCVKLVLESKQGDDPSIAKFDQILTVVSPGFIDDYLNRGRNAPARAVTLRQFQPKDDNVYGEASEWIRSEAALLLDLGEGNLPGMLLFGAEDPHLFKPDQGTDLLAFFGGVFERSMRRWLS